MKTARVGSIVAAVTLVAASVVVPAVRGDDAKPIDLDVQDKDVVEVVAEIAKASGKNIVVEKGIHDHVTLTLHQARWDEALQLVAQRAKCRVEPEAAGVIFLKRAGNAGAPEAPAKTAFREYPIGDEVDREQEHLKIAAVWLPPVTMDHEHHGAAPGPFTIHLECDIHATKGNENGFAVGDWVPYLTIEYVITKDGEDKPALVGELMPMIAKDGPHYGATINMPGVGRYKLKYHLYPPSKNGFGRHTDPITGVADWWKEFDVSYAWDYKGLKKD